jgi:2-polyprenyl-6-methoxyphenol hydroxylase-like FAD-dependent oxidoreductase
MVGQQRLLSVSTMMGIAAVRRRSSVAVAPRSAAGGVGLLGMRRRRRGRRAISTSRSSSRSGSGSSIHSTMLSDQLRLLQQRECRRTLSSSSSSASSNNNAAESPPERLRVAIVGGGCAGLSAALHLAPLVDAGLIASPIDIFDDSTLPPAAAETSFNSGSSATSTSSSGCAGAGAIGRDIGVGIWSTALEPLRMSSSTSSSVPRTSHELAYHEMTKHGTWVGDVGYRTIDGDWLMHSHLPTNRDEMNQTGIPGLLFLRERDMLSSLQKAVAWEEAPERGTIRTHHRRSNTASSSAAAPGRQSRSRIMRLEEDSGQPWSTRLVFGIDLDGTCQYSERDYHLIVAADGTNSVLRKVYGGHDTATSNLLTGGAASSSLASPIELPHLQQQQQSNNSSNGGGGVSSTQEEAVGLQNRNYTVFRGNANITQEELLRKCGGVKKGGGGSSFQTWGNGQSMRFATVPMLYPIEDDKSSKHERQVWFITIDNDEIAEEPDAYKRRDLLLEQFKDWHEPIKSLVMATKPEETLMERAIAHRHCMGPVLSLNRVVSRMHGRRPPNSGEGPSIVFLGDAAMTIDPILAQGFTVAMEGAHSLRNTVENACVPSQQDPTLGFDPFCKCHGTSPLFSTSTCVLAADQDTTYTPHVPLVVLRGLLLIFSTISIFTTQYCVKS